MLPEVFQRGLSLVNLRMKFVTVPLMFAFLRVQLNLLHFSEALFGFIFTGDKPLAHFELLCPFGDRLKLLLIHLP